MPPQDALSTMQQLMEPVRNELVELKWLILVGGLVLVILRIGTVVALARVLRRKPPPG